MVSLRTMLRTESQRTELCKDCPVARVADLLGDSCSLLIVRDLMEAPRRFGELQESLSGISTRTLTNKLRQLEKESLIKKKGFHYTATKKGAALEKIIDAMRAYGKKYL